MTDAVDPNVPIRDIDGRPHTNRAGVAQLAGWKPGHTATVRATTDPDYPRGTKIGREFWYPLDGESGVTAYLELLAARAQAKKPPAVKPGDPDDSLNVADAADALHITPATMRHYVRLSLPYWNGDKHGRPILPPPDVQEDREDEGLGPYIHREWYRRTLDQHQKTRPGPGNPDGRPSIGAS